MMNDDNTRSSLLPALLALAALTLCAGFPAAETYYVPGDYNSISSAMSVSTGGDSIIVGPGVYHD
ncbi:MAG: hypothetical protein GF355_10400, partial [Candidatus Eisenbacteria bacterium]|nr:hypothetical protein [Candidatus Eisenbacteria bacterium]